MSRRRIALLTVFSLLTLASLLIGAESLEFSDLGDLGSPTWTIILHSRIPRTLAIILSATGLSVTGLMMQAIGKNKFISAGTVGTTDAALLGLMIGYLLFGSQPLIIKWLFAFVVALAATFLFMMLLSKMPLKDLIIVPLIGMMFGGVLSAVSSYLAYQFDALNVLASIGVGSFSTMTTGRYELLLVIIIPLIVAWRYSHQFALISLGKDFSSNLGVRYHLIVNLGLVIIALVSAASFASVGPLPFVGLIVPNIVTHYYGDHLSKSIIDLGLFGSVFVLANDVISRVVIYPYEISVSFTMGITGALVFLIMLSRWQKNATQ